LGTVFGILWLYSTKYRVQTNTAYISKRTAGLVAGAFIFFLLLIGNYTISDSVEYTPIGGLKSLLGDPSESVGAASVQIRREMLNLGLLALPENPIWGYGFFSRMITREDL